MIARRRRAMLGLALTAAVLTGCTTMIAGTPSSQQDPSAQQDSNPASGENASPEDQYKKPILKQQPGQGSPLNYGSTPAYDACTVLPMTSLRNYGFELDYTQYVNHEFLERTVSAAAAQRGANPDLSHCVYYVAADSGSTEVISLGVAQRPHNIDADLDISRRQATRKGAQPHDDQGFQVAVTQEDNHGSKEWVATLSRDDLVATLFLSLKQETRKGKPVKDIIDQLIHDVATNLAKGQTAPSRFSFQGSFRNVKSPCQLLGADEFQQTYGASDSGRVREQYSNGEIMVAEYDGTQTYHVKTSCRRDILGNPLDADFKSVTITLGTYPDEASAKYAEFDSCDPKASSASVPSGPPIKIDTKVGDGITCFHRSDPLKLYSFRVGNTWVEIADRNRADTQAQVDQLARMLTPLAQKIAAKLR